MTGSVSLVLAAALYRHSHTVTLGLEVADAVIMGSSTAATIFDFKKLLCGDRRRLVSYLAETVSFPGDVVLGRKVSG